MAYYDQDVDLDAANVQIRSLWRHIMFPLYSHSYCSLAFGTCSLMIFLVLSFLGLTSWLCQVMLLPAVKASQMSASLCPICSTSVPANGPGKAAKHDSSVWARVTHM